jgi:hypothetical protein
MRGLGGLWQGLGLVVLLLLVVIPSSASAATSVSTFAASHYFAARITLAAAPPVATGAYATLHLGVAPGYAAAGVQGTSPGLQGTTVVIPSCAAACTDRYRPAASAILAAGHYVERVIFTVTQPRNTGPALGFDVDIAVHLTTGWVVGIGYFSSGVATGAGTSTISLRLYVDLGTAAPTVTTVEVTVNLCTSTAGCP